MINKEMKRDVLISAGNESIEAFDLIAKEIIDQQDFEQLPESHILPISEIQELRKDFAQDFDLFAELGKNLNPNL